jgi:hypothetical protein
VNDASSIEEIIAGYSLVGMKRSAQEIPEMQPLKPDPFLDYWHD